MNYRCPACDSTNLIAQAVKSFNPRTGEELQWLDRGVHAVCECTACGHGDLLAEFDADALGYATVKAAA